VCSPLLAPTINLDAESSTDEYQVPVKPKIKSESTAAHHSAVSFLIHGTEAKVDVVLAPDSEDPTTESSEDDKSKGDSLVNESASEDDGLAGDHTSVRQRLQSEVSHWLCLLTLHC